VFTAFMTGNFVFLGLRIGGAPGPHITSVIVAMCAFAAGVCSATRIVSPAPRSDVWPRRVTQALGVTVIAQAAFAVLWLSLGGHASVMAAHFLLGISPLGMGFQTAAVFSLGIQGVFTTAATATFTVLSGDSWLTVEARNLPQPPGSCRRGRQPGGWVLRPSASTVLPSWGLG
jgi:uncharacterized membrane protein YoaK (UPF0700 family)